MATTRSNAKNCLPMSLWRVSCASLQKCKNSLHAEGRSAKAVVEVCCAVREAPRAPRELCYGRRRRPLSTVAKSYCVRFAGFSALRARMTEGGWLTPLRENDRGSAAYAAARRHGRKYDKEVSSYPISTRLFVKRRG
jgi:hypothetical protein